MSIEVKINYNYNMDDINSKDNLIKQIINPREKLVADEEFNIDKNKIHSIFTTRPWIWMRTFGIEKDEIEMDDDGIFWYHTPMRKREASCKFGSRFILSLGSVACGYWYSSPKLQESFNYISDKSNDVRSKEWIKAKTIYQYTVKGPFTSLVNILTPKTPDRINIMGNDIAIGRRKICGTDEHLNSSGTYHAMGTNWYYDDEFFKKLLSEDEYHRSTRMGISGISNEIPGYGKEEFMEEWMTELKRIVAIAEDYIND